LIRHVILSLKGLHKPDPRFDLKSWLPKSEGDRIFSLVGYFNVDRTLLIDMAKTLPFFCCLEPGDKVNKIV